MSCDPSKNEIPRLFRVVHFGRWIYGRPFQGCSYEGLGGLGVSYSHPSFVHVFQEQVTGLGQAKGANRSGVGRPGAAKRRRMWMVACFSGAWTYCLNHD
jgi:hypothetical protein